MATIIDYRGVQVDRAERTVLKDVTFSVEEGEFRYLVGRVGSGKSSLMKTMYADVAIPAGEKADVLGFDLLTLRKKDVPYLRRKIGIVFQDFQLLSDRSAAANLRFVLQATGWKNKSEIEDRIHEVLKAVEMENKAYKMPHELSGGEQQRVVIARAMLNTPSLILADEPTGNLDPETGESIFALLNSIATEGTSVLIATHNHSLIDRYPGRVLLVEDHLLSELP